MISYLKILGPPLVVALAMGAVMASSASAVAEQGELTSDGPVRITGTDTQKTIISASGKKLTCHGHYGAGKQNETEGTPSKHKIVTEALTTLTVSAGYTNCETHLNPAILAATVTMNSCDYLFHIGKTTIAPRYAVTLDIVCPAGKVIEIHAYSGATHESSVCTKTLAPQTGLTGGFAQNVEEGGVKKITLGGTFSNITLTKHKTVLCGAEEVTKTAELSIHAILSGTNAEGASTELKLSEV